MRLVALNDTGRRIGETHHNATISDAIVNEVRRLHEEEGVGYWRIAKQLGLKRTTVVKICRYQRRACTAKHWKRVDSTAQGRPPCGNHASSTGQG